MSASGDSPNRTTVSQPAAFRFGWPAAAVAIVAILALSIVLGVRACMRPAVVTAKSLGGAVETTAAAGADAARTFAEAFRKAFHIQPTVTTKTQVVAMAPIDAARLVVVEQTVPVRSKMTSEFLKSTKRLEAEGEFRILAGYDLAKPFDIQIADNGRVRIAAPPPAILAVETLRTEIAGQDGLWNKISDDERNQALRQLQIEARAQVEEDLIEEARSALTRLVAGIDPDWTIDWQHGPEL